jgi:hypothetical protein
MFEAVNDALAETIRSVLEQVAHDYDLDYGRLVSSYLPKQKKPTKASKKNEYIETEEFDYLGSTYLVDSDNTVYTRNSKRPVIVGCLRDGIIVFN